MGIKKILALTTLGFVNTLGAGLPGISYSYNAAGINTMNHLIAPLIF